MALTDAQAKIIAASKKKKEDQEAAARKLAAAQLANAAKNHQTLPVVTPSRVVSNHVQTPLKSGKPVVNRTTASTSAPKRTTGSTVLSDYARSNLLERMTDSRGQLYTPLDVVRYRASKGESAASLAAQARGYDNGDWQENLRRAAEERVARRQKLDSYVLSDADSKLPSTRREMVQEAKDAWQRAKDEGDIEGMRRAHEKAENVRGWAGYSGGPAGDEYITADLTWDEKRTLNQTGQNKLKKAKLDRQKAWEEKDAKGVQDATRAMAEIMSAVGYRANPSDVERPTDAYGRPLMTAEERLEDAARAMAGVKSVGTGVAGSLLSLAETGNQAMRNYTRERWGRNLEANANQYNDPLLAQKARARLGESDIVDPNLPGQSLMRKSQEYASEALEGTSGVEKFLGETALSIGQNLPGIALSMIPGAQGAGLALLGAQAAGARAWELNEQSSQAFLASLILGGEPEDYGSVEPGEALLRGLASGGVELLTEKIPLDNLAKVLRGQSGQNGLKSILKQMGIEGVEEGTAYTANFLLDKIAQDPNAEWTVEEFLKNAAMGAVSGGAMAGGATALRGAAEASRYAPSSTQTQEPTVESVLRNRDAQVEGEQKASDSKTSEAKAVETKASDSEVRNEVRTEARTAQEAAEGPVETSREQEATTLPEAKMEQPVQVREAQVTAPAIQQKEQQKKGEQVKLKRIESIPAEVEVMQSKRVTAPVVSANYLSEMSSTLGKSGSKAMQVAWDGKGNQAQYSSDFIRVYNQALTGTSTGRIQAPDSLSDAQVKAAYDAGKNDRQFSLEEAKTAAQFAPVAGKDSGLVYDDYVKAEMDTTVASEINTVAKQLGLRVQMVDSVKGGEANADIQGSVVSIEKGNPHPVRFLFGHEMTHRVQTLAPESYREFRDFVMSSLKAQDEVRSKLAAYKSRGVDIDSEGAIDEIVADYAGQLIESKDLMKRFIDQNRKNQSMLSRFLTALKDLATKLTGRRKAQVNDAAALLEKAVGEASKQAKKLEKGGNASQTGMVYDDGNGHSRYSLKTYREGGRDTLGRWLADRVKAGDLDGRDAKDMIKEMDQIYDICEKYTDVYAPFGKWSEAEVVRDDNGDPVFSVVKANGDYPMNMDFSLVCKKRRPLDAVLNSLVEQGLAEKFALDKESIVVLNDIIRRHGFETACSLCFVDAKRFRVTEVADQFASMYNRLVRSMIPKGKSYQVASFNFGGDKTVKKVSGGIDTMKDGDLNFKEIEKTIRTTGEKSVAHKIAVHLRDNPADRKLVRRGDFISTAGFDRVKKDNPALLSLYNSKKGSAGPKASFSDVQYLSEVLEQKFFKRDAAYAVGGVQTQSFSDYMPRLFFDYAQMIADLAAKKLPAHGYTKEALFAQQFGQTGVKINLSLVPKVVEGGVAPGLDANGNYAWQEGQSFGSAVSDKDNGKAGFDLAVQIQNAEGYGDNCGTIAVGVSDRHIEKMLDDPDIRMIIPYHKSGLNPVVAAMNKIDKFENYTNYQNTRSKKTGKKADAHFDFNTELQKLGDAKAAADAYLAWCEENGYLPKFDIPSRKFFPSQHPNYYKLLIDFSAYNSDGKATPQGDVRIQYPQEGDAFGSLNNLIKQGLEEDALAQAKLDKGVKPILDDVEKELSARFSLKGISGYENLVEKFGAIEPGEDPRARDIQVPKQTEEGKKVSRTVRTILEAGSTTDEMVPTIKKMVEDGEFSYEVASDKAAIETAEATIRDKGFQAALMDWTSSLAKGEVNKQNVATGWALYDAAAQAGDAKTAADIMTRIVIHQRNAAQAVQATRILKRMSPSAQLYGIQRSVQNMQEELNTKYGDKAPNLKVPDELIDRYLNAENQEERDEAEIEIYRNIGKQMPSTFIDKWNAWRYLAMLGNFRTHIRNTAGNLVFAPFVAAKNVVGIGLEGIGSVASGGKMQRTKGVATPSLLAAGWNDYQNVVDQIMAGGKYDDSTYKRDAIAEGRQIFRFKPLELLRRLNSWALEKEDGWFAQPHYANALAQYCAANGITAEQYEKMTKAKPASTAVPAQEEVFAPGTVVKATDRNNYGKVVKYNRGNNTYLVRFVSPDGSEATVTLPATSLSAKGERRKTFSVKKLLEEGKETVVVDQARAYAIEEAQKATYRDFNQFSDFIGTLGRYGGNNKVRKAFSAAVEGVLPFRKTPANILVRALEYSPVGLIQGTAQLAIGVPRKMNTAAEALDHLASGLTGTGLVAAGYFLAKMGLLTAGPDDDEEQAKFDDLTGKQEYAWMRKDGTNFTLDWLAPECIPLLVGADIFAAIAEETDSEEKRISAFLGAMSQITDPLLEMSCLSSLNELFDNLNQFSEDGIQAGPVVVANMVVSYLTQGIPTLLGQGERASEVDRMTTYTDKNGELPTDWQYVIGRASARIPKWDYNQIPYIDAWGRTESEASKGKRIVNNFINPAYTSKYYVSQMEAELQRLYDVIGDEEDVRILPSRADRYFNVDGARVDLTAEQYVTYAKEKGQRSYALMQNITTSSWYAGADDAVKAEVISNAYQVANEDAKKALFPDYVSKNNVYLKAAAARDQENMAVGDYLYLYAITGDVESLKYKSGSDAGETISNSKSYQIAEKIYDSPIVLTDSQRAFVYEAFGVGKTVSKANYAKVKQELATMRKQAGV